MKWVLQLLLSGILLLLASTGCRPAPDGTDIEIVSSPEAPTPEVIASPTKVDEQEGTRDDAGKLENTPLPEGYPAPAHPPSHATPQGYPAPPTREPFVFPESDPGYATVKGVLLLIDPVNAALTESDSVYLLPVPAGEGIVYPEFDETTAIRATCDSVAGDFRFLNVPVGTHAMVAFTISGRISVSGFAGGGAVLILVTDDDLGTTIDLGQVRVP